MLHNLVLHIGVNVIFTQTVSLEPYTTIAVGERASVAFVEECGAVALRLDAVHCGLATVDNLVWLEPHMADDIFASITAAPRRVPKREQVA